MRFLCVTMWILCGLSLICVCGVLMHAFSLTWTLTYDGLKYFVNLFAPFYDLIGGSILCLTAYIALKAYLSSCKVEEIQAIEKMRELLSTNENMEIHQLIQWCNDEKIDLIKDFTGGDTHPFDKSSNYFQKNEVHVYNYFGTLDMLYDMYCSNILPADKIYYHFGYRIMDAYRIDDIKKIFEADIHLWKQFIDLRDLMIKNM